ncbi:activating signal cointegrator 1 complex subunit 2 [Trichomycterus rosablanca]|uniref:activating signal cointegrator 1 complex subunit 2 n=1 Tax=Trichomycterus rosablanca TaxID=2290929 RepID=UPI002F35CC4E
MACSTVPLDEQQVTEALGPHGTERTLPALHPDRKEERGFLPYKPPPDADSPAQVEEFLEHAQFIAEDLDWLLGLPHDKFWCQVVFDESLQRCLDSYLRLAPRGIDSSCLSLSPAVSNAQRLLHRSVFMVFLRMATHKESKENFITPAVFGEIIYDNFLFDIPKILDLCVLFGRGNSQLLQKMMENIFKQQPGYYGDLNETVPSIIQVFGTILGKCGLQSEELSSNEPLKLNTHPRLTAMTMKEEDFSELVCYLCDTCTTIHSFLDIFPEACNTFHQHGFLNRLSSFYEMALPEMERVVTKRNFDKYTQDDLWRRLSHSRRRMLDIAHTLLQHTCLQPILEGSENTVAHVEDFLQTFTVFLQEKRFLADYDEVFPVAEDVSLLQQAFPHLDETRTSYLLHAVESAWESTGKKRPSHLSANHSEAFAAFSDPSRTHADEKREEPAGAECTIDFPQKGANGAECSVSAGELESLLSHIRDLLPDLGEGFLLSCLRTYGYDSELVINNILEDRLTPELSQLDRNLPRPAKEAPAAVLNSRSNVFHDDEFDVFTRDKVDMSRVWRGRRQGESVKAMLDDKQHINDQRDRYRSYQTVVDEVPIATGHSGDQDGASYVDDDYDDDYDDTYDINQVGANDLDEDDELLNRRPFTTPQVLRRGRAEEEEEDDDEEGRDESKEEAVKRDHFLQDPALLRERAEARRAAMQSRRGYRPPPASNVVGGPKGRGQTRETDRDRRRKEANKGRGANHGRRAMADRKRNKGMIPS